MIGALFDMFTVVMFIFSSARFLNMCKPRASWSTSIDILWSEQAGYDEYSLAWFIPSEIFFQVKFSILKAVSSKRLPFYLGRPLHAVSSFFSHFCFFQNAILHKMLKLRFWNFKPVFLRIEFSLVATFLFSSFGYLFELIFASYTVSWVFTIYTFNIWRWKCKSI